MRQISILECLLSGVRGYKWLRPIMPSIKWRNFPRTRLQLRLPDTGKSPRMAVGGPGACRAGLRGAIVGRQAVKPCSPVATEMGERSSTYQTPTNLYSRGDNFFLI
jgi:hypothetical protein